MTTKMHSFWDLLIHFLIFQNSCSALHYWEIIYLVVMLLVSIKNAPFSADALYFIFNSLLQVLFTSKFYVILDEH